MLPRLHVVTDDAVLADRGFEGCARGVLVAGGDALALHLRGRRTSGALLYARAAALRADARRAGARLLVNDRVDVALACAADGVQLNCGSLAVPDARTLLGPAATIGYSAHGVEESATAVAAGADFVVLGSIWQTPTHPDAQPAGTAILTSAAREAGAPIIAIGGISPDRVAEAVNAGAYGVAVLSGVWSAADPGARVAAFRDALAAEEQAWKHRR